MDEESTIFDASNARHMSPSEIADTFIPPIGIFSSIASKGNHIITGPRGSGKTTLLRMLTFPALIRWRHLESDHIAKKINFVGVFIAADKNWHGQLKSIPSHVSDPLVAKTLGEATFTTHILKALIRTFQDLNSTSVETSSNALAHQITRLTAEEEAQITTEIAEVWRLRPRLPSLTSLQSALSARLAEIGELRRICQSIDGATLLHTTENRHLFLDHTECVTFAIELHNSITLRKDRHWCLLFDEIEIAPSGIQKELLNNLRGVNAASTFSYKVALAPFNKHSGQEFSELMAAPGNDFKHIDLTYARKEYGYEFSQELINSLLRKNGMPTDNVKSMLGDSASDFWDESSVPSPYSSEGIVGKSIHELLKKDPSFANYMRRNQISPSDMMSLQESERAHQFRKMRSIVVIRNHFAKAATIKRSDDGISDVSALGGRSRKSLEIYTGFPSMLALTEGNPRWLLGMFGPLVQELAAIRIANSKKRVGKALQARELEATIRTFRSLLKTIPYKPNEANNRGLLKFLDAIGKYFHHHCVIAPFAAQPPLTFMVDSHTDDETLEAIGRALNVGAIIYIPDRAGDTVLTSVRGKRFRLCYLLAAHYEIPIILNRSISLSRILSHKQHQSKSGERGQEDLPFDE